MLTLNVKEILERAHKYRKKAVTLHSAPAMREPERFI
jgi:hypothetical protein